MNSLEISGTPQQQLYKLCINHLIDMNYKFKLEFEHSEQVVIDMGRNGCVDFFLNSATNSSEQTDNKGDSNEYRR